MVRNELAEFYSARRRSHPGETLTQANDLTVKRFGTRNDPALRLSGAETWGFLLCCVSALDAHGPNLPPEWRRLYEAGRQLEHVYTVMQGHGNVLPKNALQDVRGTRAGTFNATGWLKHLS